MKKRGLKDIKQRNRQVILQAVLENGGLSRIEIAEKTELAASTVSTLIGELLEEGLLIESGNQISTGGRNRIELTINPRYGRIAVIEIGRREVCMEMFDMALKSMGNRVLSKYFSDGNDLYDVIVDAIASCNKSDVPLAGIGLLFQEDIQDSDFRVMYSTGAASASITLREALMSLFRIPIVEEFSPLYAITQAMRDIMDPAARNSAHINMGKSVFATVTIEGKTLPLRGDSCETVNRLICDGGKAPDADSSLMRQVENLIVVLCSLFSLDSIFISGVETGEEKVSRELWSKVSQKLTPDKMPDIRFLKMKENRLGKKILARKVQMKVLVSQ